MKFRNFMHAALPAAVMFTVMFTSAMANASCANPNRQTPIGRGLKGPATLSNGNGSGNRNGSIVGLWLVNYSFGVQSFDQWHADGNEFEASNPAPFFAVVCQGTYVQMAPGTYKLVHVGWNFDINDGHLVGYFVETQVNSVSGDGNSYTGLCSFNFFLMDGTPDPNNAPFAGTLTATRITATS